MSEATIAARPSPCCAEERRAPNRLARVQSEPAGPRVLPDQIGSTPPRTRQGPAAAAAAKCRAAHGWSPPGLTREGRNQPRGEGVGRLAGLAAAWCDKPDRRQTERNAVAAAAARALQAVRGAVDHGAGLPAFSVLVATAWPPTSASLIVAFKFTTEHKAPGFPHPRGRSLGFAEPRPNQRSPVTAAGWGSQHSSWPLPGSPTLACPSRVGAPAASTVPSTTRRRRRISRPWRAPRLAWLQSRCRSFKRIIPDLKLSLQL